MISHRTIRTMLVSALAILFMVASVPAISQGSDESGQSGGSRGVHRTLLTAVANDTGAVLSLYGESHALLIGASRYSTWSRLSSVPGELDSVAEALSSTGFNVERLVDPDSTNLKEGIIEFINNYGYTPENRLLIYFSGHGHSIGTKGFLLPVDIPVPEKNQEFRRKALPMSQIMAWAKDMEAKHVMFVFDSCFSGSIFKSRSMPVNEERYIRQATALPVRQFITAGSANEEVPANSTFTPAFVEAIKGAGDLNKDGYITGSELGVHLSQLVPQFVPQTPQYGKIRDYDLSRGDFVFFGNKNSEPEPQSTTVPGSGGELLAELPTEAIELLIWQSAEKGDSPGEYEAYLSRYPKGIFASIARVRLDYLSSGAGKLYFEPEMVRVNPGTFMMGSRDGRDSEKPEHFVVVDAFELGKYEVTFEEFDAFTQATARQNLDDGGWGRGKRPVVNVSWEVAKEYVKWLSIQTGRQYRLPTEAEWEYAARAGSIESYSFGNDDSLLCDFANISFKATVCNDPFKFTSPVGSFAANFWGLHDLHGNVWEWTEDCWNPDYNEAPVRSIARTSSGDCDERVVRGGAWYSESEQLRSSVRNKYRTSLGSDSTGFRIARTLSVQ